MIMGKWIVVLATSVIGLTVSAMPAQGQIPDFGRKTAITRLAEVDEDFHFLGEYQGHAVDPRGGMVSVGLQVMPSGDGEFSGVRYRGGLPGTGWNRVDREVLAGEREGNVVTLTGPQTRIEVRRGGATLFDAAGLRVTPLQKVQRLSPTLGAPAPTHAYTLFDGSDVRQFEGGKISEEGWLEEGTELVPKFRDYTLHIEFRLPYMPKAANQGRANSGVYLQSSYEVQILDSFGLEGKANECGALYRYRAPDVNMCLPPLAWQTYDLTFRSPRYDSVGNKYRNARITVLHNGVVVHDNVQIESKTGAGKQETGELWPIKLQDHGNPVRFRNIWLIDLQPTLPAPPARRLCPPRRYVSFSPGTFPVVLSHPPSSRSPADLW